MNLPKQTAWRIQELHLRGNTALAVIFTETFISETLNADEPTRTEVISDFMDLLSKLNCDEEMLAAAKLIADSTEINKQLRWSALMYQASHHLSNNTDIDVIKKLIDEAYTIDKDACNRAFTYSFFCLLTAYPIEALLVFKNALKYNHISTYDKDNMLRFIIKQKLDERYPHEVMIIRKLADF